ncbi:MAG: hypothetical protein WCS69_13640 [Ignavibacteriaceae bacterium]|jgi:hypothetical protein
MKKSFLFLLTAFLAVTFFFVGCNKATNNPTDNTDTTTTTKTDQPIPTFPGSIDGEVTTIQFTYTIPNLPAPLNTISVDMGFANFGAGTDAGTVTVNGKAVAKNTSSSTIYYNSFSTTSLASLGLDWDGAIHTWNVTGAGSTPAFTIDVTSPTEFTVNTPTTSTVASKSSALNIAWTGANATSADSMMIVLVPTSGSGTTFTATTNNKTGSYTIASSSLSGFSGDVLLEVVKYRYAMKTVNSKTFVGVAEIVNTVNFKIQ